MSMIENWVFETKCRRCGHLSEWFFGSRETIKFESFSYAMMDHIANPRMMNCEKCNRLTVQEVVTYNYPNEFAE